MLEPAVKRADVQLLPRLSLLVWLGAGLALIVVAVADVFVLAIAVGGMLMLGASSNRTVGIFLLVALIPFAHAGVGLESLPGFGIYDLYTAWFILLFLGRIVLRDLLEFELPQVFKLAGLMFLSFLPSILNTPSVTATLKAFVQLAVSILTALGLYYYLVQERGRRPLLSLLKFYCFVGVAASAVGLYSAAAAGSLAQITSGRVFLQLFGEVNYYAGYLLTSIPLLIAFLSIERKGWLRVLFLAGLVINVLALISTISRSAFLTFGVLFILSMLYFIIRSRGAQRLVGLAMLSVSVGLALLLLVTDLGKTVVDLVALSERVQMVLEGRDRSLGQRQAILEVTLNAIQTHPIIGVGYGSFEEAFDWYKEGRLSTGFARSVHNTGIRILAETGVVGFVPALLFVGALLLSVWNTMKRAADEKERFLIFSVLMSIVSFLVMSMTLDQMFEPHFWVMVAFGLAMTKSNPVSDPGDSADHKGVDT